MNLKIDILLVILLCFHVYVQSQVKVEHLEFVINDYYSDFEPKSNIKYCNVIQFDFDSLYKYCISDLYNPFPIVPPDTFLFIHDSVVVYYYYKFPPNIRRNYQILESLKVTHENHFNRILENYCELLEYDPPEPAYYFHATDTIGTKVEYDPHGAAMIGRLLKYYKKHSGQGEEY